MELALFVEQQKLNLYQQKHDLVSSINSATNIIKLPWAKFPKEMHLPGMNFASPGTDLDERLTTTDAYKEWSKPVDRVDNAAYHHYLAYNTLQI